MDLLGHILWPLALVLLLSYCNVHGKRILMLNFPMKSHTSELRMIGEALMNNGHEVYGVLPPSFPGLAEMQAKTPVTYLTYEMKADDMYSTYDNMEITDTWMEELIQMTFLEDVSVYNVDPYFPILPFCTNPLSDEALIKKLKSLNFDLAIVDGFMEIRCMYVLVYKLGISYVSQTTQYEPWLQRNPALPSFVPFPVGTGDYGYTEKMTFWQRLYNIYILVKWTAFPGVEYLSDDLVRKYAPEKPFKTIDELAQQSLMWLMDMDVLIDFARPLLPNMVEVGGLTTRPPKPLPKDLEEFVKDAEHGVIVVSFGTLGASLPKYMSDRMIEAFKKVPQHIVWAFPTNIPSGIPDKMKLLPWIPQNDLLGHPNTRLFITHCGANSQFESLYNAVPMIAMPAFGDQPYNAMRGEYNGIGIQMNLLTFTSDELVENIHKVIHGDYGEKIRNLSNIFKERPFTPVERSVFWIEHVLKYGAKHLHSHAVDMVWYEYLMLDILAFVLFTLVFSVMLLICTCKFIYRKMCGSAKKQKVS